MADSKLVRQCDGSDYNEFKDDLVQLQVLSDAEYVLQHPCPGPGADHGDSRRRHLGRRGASVCGR